MGGEKGHFGNAELDALHLDPESTAKDAGACLTGHLFSFKDFKNKKSCNYRWQCYVGKNASDRLHSYETSTDTRARYRTDLTITNPKDSLIEYCFFLPKPQPGDWHIGGPYRDIKRNTFAGEKTTIKKGENFTRWVWPYWNNAHHIIPKGSLKAEIQKQGGELADIIQKALLKAKYNVNHKINVVFLPMDKAVGSILKLPRHLERRALKSHPVYDAYVKAKQKYGRDTEEGLSKVVDHYAKIAKKAQDAADPENHEIPNAKLSKAKLEKLSRDLLKLILEWGEAGTGESLDEKAEVQSASDVLQAS